MRGRKVLTESCRKQPFCPTLRLSNGLAESFNSSLVAQRLPIPLRNRLRPLLGFCHLERSDQPFETHLQTAWISFGKQMRLTFASVEGGIRQTG